MKRRALLSLSPLALAGCVSTGVETPTRPRGPPNFLGSYEWLPEQSACRVTFDRGNIFTAENTGKLVVSSALGEMVQWVGGDDPAAEFPLEPGASVIAQMPEPDRLVVAWYAPGGEHPIMVDSWSGPPGDGS